MFLCKDLIPKCHLAIWIHTPHKTRRLRGKRIPDQEWNQKVSKELEYHQIISSFLKSQYCQILCGLDKTRYNAMLILAMMVIRRKGPLNHGPSHQYRSPQIAIDRMKDVEYDDVLLNMYEPKNIQHVLRDHFLETPWEPPSSASAPSR